jgi:hypothetical protein
MNFQYQHLLPENFAPESKVWIFQSSRPFSITEALNIEGQLEDFIQSWKSHGAPVKGYANLFFGQFVVLMADETHISVGGCSTDGSVRVIKQMEEQFNVQFFDRTSLAFVVKDKVQLLPLSQLAYAVEHQFIDANTLYFNNTVLTLDAFRHQWLIPVKDSWLANRLPKSTLA